MKMKSIFFKAGFAAMLLTAIQACTNLDEKVYDRTLDTDFGKNEDQLEALVGPLYGGIGDYYGNFAGLNAVTDEQIVPTRGGDWKDGDQWRRLEMHTWDPALDDSQFNGLWTWMYGNTGRINQLLTNPDVKNNTKLYAQLRVIRAFYHYLALDNFGNGIIITEKDAEIVEGATPSLPKQVTRQQMYDFVESEILAAMPDLSREIGGASYGRMNTWVAHMILAKLYLNAEVYTGTPQWQKAWAECDTIIEKGTFSLNPDFFANFAVKNEGSPETIFATPMDKTKRTGLSIQFATLHYKHQLTYDMGAAPWNGYATAEEFYDPFEDDDIRKDMWIIGQQYDIDGKPLKDDDLDMVIKKEIPLFEMPAGADGRLRGARSQKYEIQLHNHTSGNSQDNDFVVYRLADVYLMRGEASWHLGNKQKAADDFNYVRSRRVAPGGTLTPFDANITEDDMYAERGRELAWEYHRRQDMIRFGKFGEAFGLKKTKDDKDYTLFPIPQSQLNLNPGLIQNEAYR